MIQNISLSIIVPTYNVQAYIEKCVTSITQQLQAHHELIIINDGSSDNTPALIAELQRNYAKPNFNIINQSNHGISEARNRGIKEAKGEYIVFVDSDDLLLPGALEALDDTVNQYHPDVIACDFNIWYPENEAKTRNAKRGYPSNILINSKETILNTYFTDRHMYVWANVFKRDIYEQQSAPIFPPDRVFEDVSVLSKLLNCSLNLYYLPKNIINYRQHPVSITKVITEKWCLDLSAALLQIKVYFQGQETSDSIKSHIDVAMCYFYLGIVKNSYQLPLSNGRSVRAKAKATFIATLFNGHQKVFDSMTNGEIVSNDSRLAASTAKQVTKAFAGDMIFGITKTVSRRIKLWRRLHTNT